MRKVEREEKAISDLRIARKIADNTFKEIRRLYKKSKRENSDLDILGRKYEPSAVNRSVIGMSGYRIIL